MTALENTTRAMLAGILCTVSACGTGDATDERLGQVEVTLTGVDGSGNTWKLPTGTSVEVHKGNFHDYLSLDGNVPVKSFSLPPGQYQWQLWNTNGYSLEWPLERVDTQNNSETVMATLVNPQPDNFLILPENGTNLMLQFNAAQGGVITFVKGTVDVSLDVSEVAATGADIAWNAVVQTSFVTLDPNAPPVLASRLPTVGESAFLDVFASLDGPWDMIASSIVCAPIALSAVGAGNGTGFADLTLESAQANEGQICVYDTGLITIFMDATHAPATPTFNDLGATEMNFFTGLMATLPAPAFDGDNLDLEVLSGTYVLPTSVTQHAADTSSGHDEWYSADYTGQVTFTFAPTL